MNKLTPLALAATLASISIFPAAIHADSGNAPAVTAGKSLYSADGKRLGAIYSVNKDGTIEIIIEGRLVTIKADTVSGQTGKLVTSLTKSAVLAAR